MFKSDINISQRPDYKNIFLWFFVVLVPNLQAELTSRNMDKSITHQAIVQLAEVRCSSHIHPICCYSNKRLALSVLGSETSLIYLSTGSRYPEYRNNPLEKKTGVIPGPQPSMFYFSLFQNFQSISCKIKYNYFFMSCFLKNVVLVTGIFFQVF